ncbi:methyl-accepting chemotaxis protein [Aliiglaciecola sp. CAU 1673]|uniref:methyl-accepting chemotaxis protein n=1 Tax=Aliiglaciecola sp. CAU 1673 TaxID=3032595 RepID=UPI0023DA01A2|nr:methyl-accepting chemotaxis protein [Aliiglaciecola sp. CAU 1673]MDF2178720.1 methyl-accepting chemotaxis protein [Aliiglaciecola sp. CAU 1673]
MSQQITTPSHGFSLRSASISSKLMLMVGVVLFIVTLAFLLYSRFSLQQTQKEIVGQVSNELETELIARLQSQASKDAADVTLTIEKAFQYPAALAARLAKTIDRGDDLALSRPQVERTLKDTLSVAPASSMYAQFETQGFHDNDADYLEGTTHSVVGVGTLEVYFVRETDGTINQVPVEDAEEKHDATLDEFGLREAEWYLCPFEQAKPCVSDPYEFEIRPGYSELMTSIVAPVKAKGRVVGVVGADMNLPLLQSRAEQLAASLYNGKSKVYLVSQNKLLVAASDAKEKLARPLSEAMDSKLADRLFALISSGGSLREGDFLYVAAPVTIQTASTNWLMVIGVDYESAMASVSSLSKSIEDQVASLLWQLSVIALVLLVAALLVTKVVSSGIVNPVRMVAGKMTDLANRGGDLTQRLQVQTHAELIALAEGFNTFKDTIANLLEMVKSSSQEVAKSATQTQKDAELTSKQLSRQHQEIDSVVTAVTQMSATASEVASHANEAANSANTVKGSVHRTERTLSDAVGQVKQLATDMQKASEAVSEVASRSNDIRKILDVIGAIADQTNLLALNAAIEAARAGDHGRGFSVVADEVRALASKTAESVGEIDKVISGLQQEVKNTVSMIDANSSRANSASSRSEEAFVELSSIVEEIGIISDRLMQMATAAEEQSSVSEAINENIVSIGDAGRSVAELAVSSSDSARNIGEQVTQLQTQLGRLKTS